MPSQAVRRQSDSSLMTKLLEKALHLLVEWLLRKRSTALLMIQAGLVCLSLAFAAGFAFNLSMPIAGGQIDLKYDGGDGTPQVLVYCTGFLGLLLTVVGAGWAGIKGFAEYQSQAKRKVIAVEVRGLRNVSGVPLVESIPKAIPGKREQLLIDVRQYIRDGEITDPAAALSIITSLPEDLRRRQAGLDRSDITYVYGGLAPVPLTFLTGILVDDEGQFLVLDWDRHSEKWRTLSDPDDHKRFVISGLEKSFSYMAEVALVVSVSYGIDHKDVQSRVGRMPIVDLSLEKGNTETHWSDAKTQALGRQFLEVLGELNRRGVKRIHLFLAAPNSVVFRFGRLYDRRNLPQLVVYYFERGRSPPYRWGILMPVSGIAEPKVLY